MFNLISVGMFTCLSWSAWCRKNRHCIDGFVEPCGDFVVKDVVCFVAYVFARHRVVGVSNLFSFFVLLFDRSIFVLTGILVGEGIMGHAYYVVYVLDAYIKYIAKCGSYEV